MKTIQLEAEISGEDCTVVVEVSGTRAESGNHWSEDDFCIVLVDQQGCAAPAASAWLRSEAGRREAVAEFLRREREEAYDSYDANCKF